MSYGVRVALDCVITIPAIFVAAFGTGFVAVIAVHAAIDALFGDTTTGIVCGVIFGMQLVLVTFMVACHVPMFSGRCVPAEFSDVQLKELQIRTRNARYGLGALLLVIAVQSTTLLLEFTPLRLVLALTFSLIWFPIASWVFGNNRLAIKWQPKR